MQLEEARRVHARNRIPDTSTASRPCARCSTGTECALQQYLEDEHLALAQTYLREQEEMHLREQEAPLRATEAASLPVKNSVSEEEEEEEEEMVVSEPKSMNETMAHTPKSDCGGEVSNITRKHLPPSLLVTTKPVSQSKSFNE